MKDFWKKFKEMLYPGKIKGFRVDFERENARALCFLLGTGLVISVIAFLVEFFGHSVLPTGTRTLEYVLFFGMSAALLIGYKTDLIKNGTTMLYVWICLILGWSLFMCAGDRPDYPTFLFLFFILTLSLLIRDAWGNVLILTILFAVLFVYVDYFVKKSEFFALDMLHLIACVSATLYLSQRMIHERITFMENSFTATNKADHDALTGIYNRRGGEHLISNYVANGVSGSFMLIDIDDFKHINDTYGHAAGDETLKSIAACLRENFRDTDVVMRMGGDEFIVYAVGMADIKQADVRLTKLKSDLHKIKPDPAGGGRVSASIGCVVNLGSYPNYETISAAADRLLYLVKEEGKDNFKCSAADYKPEESEAKE